jgi:hypothetical protein
MEITKHLHLLSFPGFRPGEHTYSGIKLGGPAPEKEPDKDGWVDTGAGVSCRVDGPQQTVVEVMLGLPLLETLSIKTEQGLREYFGPSDNIDVEEFKVRYFYFGRQMQVVWVDPGFGFGGLVGIYLGEHLRGPKRYTARDFLQLYYWFTRMVPDHHLWYASALKDRPYQQTHLLKLEALMRAFDIGTDLNLHFRHRAFLETHHDALQQCLREELEQTANGRRLLESFGYFRKQDVKMLFRQLFDFYLLLKKVKGYNGGWLEAGSLGLQYSFLLTNKIINSLDSKAIEELERGLARLIDPQGRSYFRQELIDRFDFPDDRPDPEAWLDP